MPNILNLAFNLDQPTAPVEFSKDFGTTWVTLTSLPTTGTSKTISLGSILKGTYAIGQLMLRPVGYSGSPASNGGPVTVVNNVLTSPTGLAVTPTNSTTIGASWNAVANASGYLLEQATNSTFTTGLTTAYAGPLLSFPNTGLTSSTGYYYRVSSTGTGFYDSSGPSLGLLATTASSKTQIIGGYDSLTFGYQNTTPATDNPIVRLGTRLDATLYGPVVNVAVPGKTYAVLDSTDTGVFTAKYDLVTYGQIKVLLLLGVNDFPSGTTVAAVKALATSVITKLRAPNPAKISVVMVTIPACNYSVGQGAQIISDLAIQQAINNFNAEIRLNFAAIGASDFIDLARDVRFQNPKDTTYYYTDNLHYNTVGSDTIAQVYYNRLITGANPTGPTLSSAQVPVVWTNLGAVTSAVGSTITVGAPESSGQSSTGLIDNGQQRSFGFTVDPQVAEYAIGLSTNSTPLGGEQDIQLGFRLSGQGGQAYGMTTGYNTGLFIAGNGSNVEVRVNGLGGTAGTIEYYVNGTIQSAFTVSCTIPVGTLYLDATALSGASVNIKSCYLIGASTSTPPPAPLIPLRQVAWPVFTGLTPALSTITPTATGAALSDYSIGPSAAALRGFFEFYSGGDVNFSVGLGTALTTGADITEFLVGFRNISGTGFNPFGNLGTAYNPGAYAGGKLFRIEVGQTSISYYKNGVLFFTQNGTIPAGNLRLGIKTVGVGTLVRGFRMGGPNLVPS